MMRLALAATVGLLGRGRQIDFADVIFVGALLRLHLGDQFLHFFLADVDEGLHILAQHALPGQFALDLTLERGRGGADAGR
jgi:hypothetical protein